MEPTDTTLWGALESESESESEDEKEEEKPDDSGIVTPAEGYFTLLCHVIIMRVSDWL